MQKAQKFQEAFSSGWIPGGMDLTAIITLFDNLMNSLVEFTVENEFGSKINNEREKVHNRTVFPLRGLRVTSGNHSHHTPQYLL